MKKRTFFIITYLLLSCILSACSGAVPDRLISDASETIAHINFSEISPSSDTPLSAQAVSLNTHSLCLIPTADGTAEIHNIDASIDYSNQSNGYIMVKYTGDCPKVKLRIIGPDEVIYTYNLLSHEYESFPLSAGNGLYQVIIYENICDIDYATCLYLQLEVEMTDEFGPFLYPNQYVNFTPDSLTVKKASELAADADSDLEIITNIYNYIVSSITYDYEKAASPPSGYLSDTDTTLTSGSGICLDYAALMAGMLRSLQIPTRLDVGYAQNAYHAWISIYTEETGWLDGMIQFKGNCWTLVDPTFGANTGKKALKKFISDPKNYLLEKKY